jgi:hypothetical protein
VKSCIQHSTTKRLRPSPLYRLPTSTSLSLHRHSLSQTAQFLHDACITTKRSIGRRSNMPIFQDDLDGARGTPPTKPTMIPLSTTPPDENVITRRVSEESIRTDLCEGPVLDSPEDERDIPARAVESNFKLPIHGTSDRVELIERLKRGESPTWLPNRNVRSICLIFIPSLYLNTNFPTVGIAAPGLRTNSSQTFVK